MESKGVSESVETRQTENDGGFGETTHHQPPNSVSCLNAGRVYRSRTQRRRHAAVSERSERTSRQESIVVAAA